MILPLFFYSVHLYFDLYCPQSPKYNGSTVYVLQLIQNAKLYAFSPVSAGEFMFVLQGKITIYMFNTHYKCETDRHSSDSQM